MPATIAAAHAGATTGEWAQALRDVFGDYRAPTGRRRGRRRRRRRRTRRTCARRSTQVSDALGRRLKILVGKPGLDGHSNGAEQIAVRARDAGHGGRLRGHPPDAVADRRLRAARGRARDRALDPLRLAPRADPGGDRGLREAGVDAPSSSAGSSPRPTSPLLREAGRRRRLHARRTSTSTASCGTSSTLVAEHHGLARHRVTSKATVRRRSSAGACASATSPPRPPRSTSSRTRAGAGREQVGRAAARRLPRQAGRRGPRARRRDHRAAGRGQVLAALRARGRVARARPHAWRCSPSTRRRKRSGGALLGDRARIDVDPADRGVFIRSTAAGDRLGGLASSTRAAAQALAAAFDVVVIETVGVGQSETDVADVADTVAVVVQPGSGDVLQFLKAGIMEVPDVLVVTKADLGQIAQAARRDLRRGAARAGRRATSRWCACPPRCPGAGHRRAGRGARRPPRAGRHRRRAGCARAAATRWRTSPPSTASAACARWAAGERPSASSPSRIPASTCPRSSRPSRRARPPDAA